MNSPVELHADILLIDEQKAREVARTLFGFRVIGTLGILRDSHAAGLIDGVKALEALTSQTNFYLAPHLRTQYLQALRRH